MDYQIYADIPNFVHHAIERIEEIETLETPNLDYAFHKMSNEVSQLRRQRKSDRKFKALWAMAHRDDRPLLLGPLPLDTLR